MSRLLYQLSYTAWKNTAATSHVPRGAPTGPMGAGDLFDDVRRHHDR